MLKSLHSQSFSFLDPQSAISVFSPLRSSASAARNSTGLNSCFASGTQDCYTCPLFVPLSLLELLESSSSKNTTHCPSESGSKSIFPVCVLPLKVYAPLAERATLWRGSGGSSEQFSSFSLPSVCPSFSAVTYCPEHPRCLPCSLAGTCDCPRPQLLHCLISEHFEHS